MQEVALTQIASFPEHNVYTNAGFNPLYIGWNAVCFFLFVFVLERSLHKEICARIFLAPFIVPKDAKLENKSIIR